MSFIATANRKEEDSRLSTVIVVTSTRTTLRPRRLTESSHFSLEESLIGFPTNPQAGFPTESPMDSLASSSGTSTRSAAKRTLEGIATIIQTNNDNPDDTLSCTLCLDPLKNTDLHKSASLKCGHIFGENCLIRWFNDGNNSDASRCPICNTKANLKDIRVLYTKNLKAVAVSEITALELKREQVKRVTKLMEMEAKKLRMKASIINTEVKRLKTIAPIELNSEVSISEPNAPPTFIKKTTLGKNSGRRVMAFDKNNFMLVMSQHSNATKLNSQVIRKMNASLLEPSNEYICAHSKQIRDMVFHPLEHNHLASVGLDAHISQTDLRINAVVSSIKAPEPLWSCCWAGDNSNVLYVGDDTGSLYGADRRHMKLLLYSIKLQKPGCVSLKQLPPSTFRSFSRGGFLKTRMDRVSLLEKNDLSLNTYGYTDTKLPLKGCWSSTSYDCQSNLILTSAIPFGSNKLIRHIVSKLTIDTKKPLSPVITFYGGDKSIIETRSCLVPSSDRYIDDPLVCCYDEGSSTIKIFNVNKKENVHNIKVTEHFLDLCPLPGLVINGRRTVAGLSENAISIFFV